MKQLTSGLGAQNTTGPQVHEAEWEEVTETDPKPINHEKRKSPLGIIVILIAMIIATTIGIFFWTSSTKKEKEASQPVSLSKEDTEKKPSINTTRPFTEGSAEFPSVGDGVARVDTPAKAWLNPRKSQIKVLGAGYMKFVLVDDTSKVFYYADTGRTDTTALSGKAEDWWKFPKGNYYIYPNGRDSVITLSWKSIRR